MKSYALQYNFSKSVTYKASVAIGYHFSGFRVDVNGVKKPINANRMFSPMYATLAAIGSDPALERHCLIIVDDASPSKPDLNGILNTDYIQVSLLQNVGVGGKENIIQTIGARLSDRVFRIDADVALETTVKPLFDAFQLIPTLSCATINAGFMGYMLSKDGDDPYIKTSQIGNAVMYDSAVLREVGYTDPELRYFEDLDWVYRSWDAGFTSVMSREVRGHTASSGCGGTANADLRREAAKLVCSKNSSLTYHLRKGNKTPMIRYHRPPSDGLFPALRRRVPSSWLALEIAEELGLS